LENKHQSTDQVKEAINLLEERTRSSRKIWGSILLFVSLVSFGGLAILLFRGSENWILYFLTVAFGPSSLYEGIQVLRGKKTISLDF